MNYIGSKKSLLPFIKETIYDFLQTDNLSEKIFCDLFAGTGTVGASFKNDVKHLISNDVEYYSYIRIKNLVENYRDDHSAVELFDELNSTPLLEDGFIYKNYSKTGANRLYFTDYNAKKIDSIRVKLDNLYKNSKISSNKYYFILSSLLESADKIANVASVYGSFLKNIKNSATRDIILAPLDFDRSDKRHKAYNSDANRLIKSIKGDILYLDPPYNGREYGANYHILNTIAFYDKFIPKGVTGLRDYNKSSFCKKRAVLNSFDDLIKNANFKYIFMSYNNEGIMSSTAVKEIMSRYGDYKLYSTKYNRFKSQKNQNREKVTEYIHTLKKY